MSDLLLGCGRSLSLRLSKKNGELKSSSPLLTIAKDKERRHQAFIAENGVAAYKARELLRYMNKTQRANEGHPIPRHPAAAVVTNKKKRRRLEVEGPSDERARIHENRGDEFEEEELRDSGKGAKARRRKAAMHRQAEQHDTDSGKPMASTSGLPAAQSPATTPPSSPDPHQPPELPTTDNEVSDEVVNISDFSSPPSSPRPRRSIDLPPRLRAERAVARIEAAAYEAEAAARRLTKDAARMRAMADRAEATARCISEHAEQVFGTIRQAGESVRLIGREADSLVEIVAGSADPIAATGQLNLHPMGDRFEEWLAVQK
ncbi:hypothetical protein B0H15DRAFT_800618 [Mycena belliarum]|uniref:Uncharacterized protein n=1 Tax=Mycena belliarum TaxID=1033014 RepID=A0AAD6U3I3_9AGAR|nr:hypothetical protein B0H15DRAFT_800618 [Mycena belliae]